MVADPEQLPDDVDALKCMVIAMAHDAFHARTLIEKLRFELARLKRQQFGASSEKLDGRVEQLELAIEAIKTDTAEQTAETVPAIATEESADKPARRALPEHLPREDVIHPGPCACPACSATIRVTARIASLSDVPERRRPCLIRNALDESGSE